MHRYKIHGDNIVECERTLTLVLQALGLNPKDLEGPSGSPLCPKFQFLYGNPAQRFTFTMLPGYSRWNQDILALIRARGGKLREATDAILTRTGPTEDTPILALEYCGALPAGNQAWQRSGRAYSYAHAQIPYLYIAELGGYELNAQRNRKAPRLPNPAVPFSYLLLSRATSAPAFPIFLRSPGADATSVACYSPVYSESELFALIKGCLFSQPLQSVQVTLENKVLRLVSLLSSPNGKVRRDTLTPAQWTGALAQVRTDGALPSYLVTQAPLPWSKTAYIEALTPSASQLMELASRYALGLTSTHLPMCLIPANRRHAFSAEVQALYPGLPQPFSTWLPQQGHLAICWVMGFKPRGDDARPDRGLPPLTRMLAGEHTSLLTVVYGPAAKNTWPLLAKQPRLLMERNGLWESILAISDAVLVDSSTAPRNPVPAYTCEHWATPATANQAPTVQVAPTPVHVGEQDVDTLLHLMFGRLAGDCVFEGLCNPPGGDWSGLSILAEDKAELRWLGLPRVTAAGAKRPDHVFQLFTEGNPPLVIAVESKEAGADVEDNIGPRLTRYVLDLIALPPSVERAAATEPWSHSTRLGTAAGQLQTSSIAAFVGNSETELRQVAERARADLVLAFSFTKDRSAATVLGLPCTRTGQSLWQFATSLRCHPIALTLRRLQ